MLALISPLVATNMANSPKSNTSTKANQITNASPAVLIQHQHQLLLSITSQLTKNYIYLHNKVLTHRLDPFQLITQ